MHGHVGWNAFCLMNLASLPLLGVEASHRPVECDAVAVPPVARQRRVALSLDAYEAEPIGGQGTRPVTCLAKHVPLSPSAS